MPKIYSQFKIGIIGGGNLSDLNILKKVKLKNVSTPYGKVNCYLKNGAILINRHGISSKIPPHKIDHLANIFAFKKLGVKYIFSFNSVGSLKKNLEPGDFLIVNDFIDFNPPTFFDKKSKFITPQISEKLRKIFIKILKKLKMKFFEKGIYFNTKGPRLETKAEINLIKNFADVVGMTMAKEATLSNELKIEYASLCLIDNFAHGISKRPLTQKEIEENQKKNLIKIEKIIEEILKIEFRSK